MHWFKSTKIDRIRAQVEQEQHALYESKLAAKDATIANLENSVAYCENIQKTFASRWQQLSERERTVEEKERDLERRESELEQRAQALYRNIEIIIARRVDEDIKGKEIGIKENWKIIKRKTRVLDERELKLHKRATLIAGYLGVSLNCILTPREKKLVDHQANELTEEHYALMDLVVSCPDDRAKDLLRWMQRFPRSSQR